VKPSCENRVGGYYVERQWAKLKESHPPFRGSVPPKDPTISWRANVALAIFTAVLFHGAVCWPRGKNAEVLGDGHAEQYCMLCLCYMGFCTSRRTVMDSKKKKNLKE